MKEYYRFKAASPTRSHSEWTCLRMAIQASTEANAKGFANVNLLRKKCEESEAAHCGLCFVGDL